MSTLKVNNILPVDSTGLHIIGSRIINALIDGVYRGAWTPYVQYQINDIVIRNNNFYKAISSSNKANFTASDWKFHVVNIFEYLQSHVNNRSNPHSVTKSQVGLGQVQNYRIASMEEAIAGEREDRYMTPLRVKESIQANVVITKQSIGLGNVDNFSTLTVEEATSEEPYLTNRYMTPETFSILINRANLLEGHPLSRNGVIIEKIDPTPLLSFHPCDGREYPNGLSLTVANSMSNLKEYFYEFSQTVSYDFTGKRLINAGMAVASLDESGSNVVDILTATGSSRITVDSGMVVTDVTHTGSYGTYILANNGSVSRLYISYGVVPALIKEFNNVYNLFIYDNNNVVYLSGTTNRAILSLNTLTSKVVSSVVDVETHIMSSKTPNSLFYMVKLPDGRIRIFNAPDGSRAADVTNSDGLWIGINYSNRPSFVCRVGNNIREYELGNIVVMVASTSVASDVTEVGITSEIKSILKAGEIYSYYCKEEPVLRSAPSFAPTSLFGSEKFMLIRDGSRYTTTYRTINRDNSTTFAPCIPPINGVYSYVRLV